MPGNKNSGRKRKIDSGLPDIQISLPRSRIDKDISPDVETPLRTRNGTELGVHSEVENQPKKAKTSPTSSRIACQDFNKAVGDSIQLFPENRLPQNRGILQRWKGLQIENQFNRQVTGRDHAHVMWPEIKAIWEASGIPMKKEKNCIDQIVDVISKYQGLKRTPDKRLSEIYQAHLNSLFDISPGEEQVKAILRAKRTDNIEEHLRFYEGQKKHPQQFTLGGVDQKEAAKERRSVLRKEAGQRRIEKELERTSLVSRFVNIFHIIQWKVDTIIYCMIALLYHTMIIIHCVGADFLRLHERKLKVIFNLI